MNQNTPIDVYADLGVRPIINCQSQRTSLGGSLLSSEVTLAMEQANSSYVIMTELMDRAGDRVAELPGSGGCLRNVGMRGRTRSECRRLYDGRRPEEARTAP